MKMLFQHGIKLRVQIERKRRRELGTELTTKIIKNGRPVNGLNQGKMFLRKH